MTLADRMKAARSYAKLTQRQLAEAAKVEQPLISQIENGKTLKSAHIAKLAHACRVDFLWLSEGIGEMLGGGRAIKRVSGTVVEIGEGRQKLRPNMLDIPQLDVAASMGSGAIRPETVDVIQRMTVSMDFLKKSVAFSKPDNLALITGYGDSMEGTFSDGDLLLVDRGVTDVKIDAVYVLALKDELYIKRLQRRPDGSFLMISDNKKYQDIEILNGDLAQFEVLGRVLLAWNARKL